jgi:general secretion pathway protein G
MPVGQGLKMQLRFPRRSAPGFTLIEVMVVVVILGILAAIIAPRIMSRPGEARITRAKQDIRGIEAALNLYKLDNFKYPTTQQGLEALVKRPYDLPSNANWKQGGYLDRLPKDPWGNPYKYLSPGTHGEMDVFTLGADGVQGGEGENADIGGWQIE